jgi:hypothetical protein
MFGFFEKKHNEFDRSVVKAFPKDTLLNGIKYLFPGINISNIAGDLPEVFESINSQKPIDREVLEIINQAGIHHSSNELQKEGNNPYSNEELEVRNEYRDFFESAA